MLLGVKAEAKLPYSQGFMRTLFQYYSYMIKIISYVYIIDVKLPLTNLHFYFFKF